MKTLIFNGSPRKNGNTSALVGELIRRLDGEVKIVRAYDCGVKPCVDCRFCWENNGCAIKDGMQAIYEDIREADNIVVASPMHFTELTGQLLAVLSRLQTFWSARFLRQEEPVPKKKKGGIIIVRGGVGVLERARETAEALLLEMNAQPVGVVFADNSDVLPSAKVPEVLKKIRVLAEALNSPEGRE